MKPFALAINGMGRIGRNYFRLMLNHNRITEIAAVNDLMSKENLIYLLRFDSIRGPLQAEITPTKDGFRIHDHEIIFIQEHAIPKLPWNSLSINTVLEATGHFTAQQDASKHLQAGSKNVLLTTYGKDIPTRVWGVNQELEPPDSIVSPGDCTINCVAPIIHQLNQKAGVQSVHINVIQGYTTRQELLDKPFKGLRRGRAAAHSIIPFEVNITPVLESIFPHLQNRIESMSTRVPIPCGAFAELSVVVNNPTTAEDINQFFLDQSKTELKGITSVTFDPIVSSDILGSSYSGVIDGLLTRVTQKHHVRMMIWFDNEWGYVNRLKDWVNFLI